MSTRCWMASVAMALSMCCAPSAASCAATSSVLYAAAAIAAGVAGDQLQRFVVGGQAPAAQAAFRVFQGAAQQRRDAFFAQRLQHIHAAAREQRGDDFEGRIFGGRADEPDGAAFHVGEKCILLGLVEAVNLVDEQDGARVHLGSLRGRSHHLLDFLDAAHHRGELDEVGLGGFGNDFGQCGFAHAGRTPEDHGAGVVSVDLHAQRLAGTEQMFLAAVLLQACAAACAPPAARAPAPNRAKFCARPGSPSNRLMPAPSGLRCRRGRWREAS